MTGGGFIGRARADTDTIWDHRCHAFEATLDTPAGALVRGGVLPPLWHWLYFQEWVRASELGLDGHPKRGGFLPALPELTRRMWAGGRVTFYADIPLGAAAQKVTTIVNVQEKSGSTGRLVFVTLRHEINVQGSACVVEEQDLVYRGSDTSGLAPAEPAKPVPGAYIREVVPDATLLFRMSALTGNGHRIHYDLAYAQREEGYPGLVVHGPLQAMLLVLHAEKNWPGRKIRTFAYRGRRPAFAGNRLSLWAWDADGKINLETRDMDGAICLSAVAELT